MKNTSIYGLGILITTEESQFSGGSKIFKWKFLVLLNTEDQKKMVATSFCQYFQTQQIKFGQQQHL